VESKTEVREIIEKKKAIHSFIQMEDGWGYVCDICDVYDVYDIDDVYDVYDVYGVYMYLRISSGAQTASCSVL
jgi:hypothetical protein